MDPRIFAQHAPQVLKKLQAEAAKRSLKEFVKQSWHVLEPGRPFVDGWVVGAMCEHLEATATGEITRLVITVPPGAMKSRLTRVAYPLWRWVKEPHLKFLGASYALQLAERDNYYARTVMTSEWYQENFNVRISGEQAAKVNFDTDAMGGMRAISVGGATTGFRGDVNICFPAGELVATEKGPMPIDYVVRDRDPTLRVWTLDGAKKRMVLETPTRWLKNPASGIIEVGFSDGSKMRCTPEHLVLVDGQWKRAENLTTRDTLPAFVVPHGTQTFSRVGPHLASSDTPDMHHAYTESFRQYPRRAFAVLYNLARHFRRYFVAMTRTESNVIFGVCNVLSPRAVGEVFNAVIQRIAVEMARVVLVRSWADESGGHALMNPPDFSQMPVAIIESGIPRRPRRRLEDFCLGAIGVGGTVFGARGDVTRLGTDESRTGDGVSLVSSGNKTPLYVRHVGHVDSTFCLTMRTGNFVCAETIVSNCDDAHNANQGESDAKRSEAVQWFLETFQTRVNDLNTSPIIVVGQRIHQEDVPQTAIDLGFEHLNIPMEWDESYRRTTSIGWTDPRTKQDELMWPERFSEEALTRLKTAMGPYAAAAQLQQNPVPRKGGLFDVDKILQLDNLPEDDEYLYFRAWDLASTAGGGAYTAGVKMAFGKRSGRFFIVDVQRKQASHAQVKKMIEDTAEEDGVSTPLSLPQDPGSAGKALVEDMIAGLAGFNARAEPQSGDKKSRAMPFSAQVEIGNVAILKRVWTKPFLEELRFFPKSRFKDQADAASSAFNALAPLSRKKIKQLHLHVVGEKSENWARAV
jgi:predicted phage terminase large subunit-like protein